MSDSALPSLTNLCSTLIESADPHTLEGRQILAKIAKLSYEEMQKNASDIVEEIKVFLLTPRGQALVEKGRLEEEARNNPEGSSTKVDIVEETPIPDSQENEDADHKMFADCDEQLQDLQFAATCFYDEYENHIKWIAEYGDDEKDQAPVVA